MGNIASLNIKLNLDIGGLEKGLKNAERKLRRSGSKLASLGDNISTAITVPLAALGYAAIKSAGDLEALQKGMVATMGNAEAARKEIALLRKESLKPGLNFQQALKGSVRLQAVEINAETARRALSGFGNALALVGGSSEQLDGVTLALTQIAAKGKISAEEINQIAERVPQIRLILKNAFGTANTEELQKQNLSFEQFITGVITELERLPKATGGIKNSLENMQLRFQEVAGYIGRKLFPVFNRLMGVVLKLTNAFTSLSPAMQDNIIKWGLILAAAGPVLKIFGTLKLIAGSLAGAMVKSIGIIKTALITIIGPIGLVVAGVSAIAIAIIADMGPARQILADVANYFINLYNESMLFRGVVESLVLGFRAIWTIAKSTFQVLLEGFKGVSGIVTALLSGDFDKIGDIIKDSFRDSATEAVKGIEEIQTAWDKAIANTFLPRKPIEFITKKDIDRTISSASTAIKNIRQKITDALSSGGLGGGSVDATEGSTQTTRNSPIVAALPTLPKQIDTKGITTGLSEVKRQAEVVNDSLRKMNTTLVADVAEAFEQTEMKGKVFGSSFNALSEKVSIVKNALNNAIDAGFKPTDEQVISLTNLLQNLNNEMQQTAESWTEVTNKFNEGAASIISSGLSEMLTSVGDSLGDMMAGAERSTSTLGVALSAIADMLLQLGKLAISTGVAMWGIKSALESLNPVAAIAGGVALVALSKFVKHKAANMTPKLAKGGLAYGETLAVVGDNPNARSNPEVIAPLDKLKNIIGSGNNNQQANLVAKVRGSDLLLMLERAMQEKQRYGLTP